MDKLEKEITALAKYAIENPVKLDTKEEERAYTAGFVSACFLITEFRKKQINWWLIISTAVICGGVFAAVIKV